MKTQENCVEITHVYMYLNKVLSKLSKNMMKFIIVDVSKYILYAPNIGYYECIDIKQLKELIRKILGNISTDIDRIFVSKNIDEKWIEQNIKLLLKIPLNQNLLLFKVSPNQKLDPALNKIVSVIPLKKREFIFKKRLNITTIIELIELYASILS
ncbi:MAG: hypothetical protein QW775_02000 [Ignisphaera sp.]|uniref:Uncharacterized protein n=1 Tax=Ignisphaera aggregans TaxID=334771 RepID=A0A7C4NNM9_9CREN